ncbi:MAG: hypothetical protein ACREGG_03960 [Candidatus Saccharimonadales bacterium]
MDEILKVAKETLQIPTFDQALARVNEISDNLGMPVDEAIKVPVAALWANGIHTTGSCEGHLDRALAFPWVDIEAKESQGWENDPKLQTEWKQLNEIERLKVEALLKEFYEKKSSRHPLELSAIGIYGAVRLQPAGEDRFEKPTKDKLFAYQQEMATFADFLILKSKA